MVYMYTFRGAAEGLPSKMLFAEGLPRLGVRLLRRCHCASTTVRALGNALMNFSCRDFSIVITGCQTNLVQHRMIS